jgi:uncharacterized protein (TIGR02001 family)
MAHDGSFVSPTYDSVSTRMKSIYVVVLALSFAWRSDYCHADSGWGGSLALTSDYLVRGISRSNDHAALQMDLHFATDSGLVTGLFVSNTRIDPDQPRDVELDGFVGFVWSAATDWRGVVRATYYSYPWNRAGSTYNYGEFEVNVVYRDSLELTVTYSPDAPRYLPYRGFVGVSLSAVELNLQHPIYKNLSGIAGVGYSYIVGPTGGGYEYGSAGVVYDFHQVAVTVSYVDTSNSAKSLFYIEKPASHWDASILYRF